MNVQGIINKYFSQCSILTLSNVDDGNEEFGPHWVTYTGTLPAYQDVVDREDLFENSVDLKTAKASAKSDANGVRVGLIDYGFVYKVPGQVEAHRYELDLESIMTINNFMTGLLGGNENPHGGYYRDVKDVHVTMSDADLVAFITAYGTYYGSLRKKLHTLKNSIDAALTAEQVEAIDLKEGWPTNGTL